MTLEDCINAIEWIPLQRYCEITGVKPNTCHMRRINGVWQEGVHIATPAGSSTFINFKAVAAWCAATNRPVLDVADLLAKKVLEETAKRRMLDPSDPHLTVGLDTKSS